MSNKSVFTIIDDLQRGLEELKHALAPLAVLAPEAQTHPAPAAKQPAAPKPPKPQRPKSPARALQGKYMSAVRGLPPAQKDAVRSHREEHGTESAIRYALELAGK